MVKHSQLSLDLTSITNIILGIIRSFVIFATKATVTSTITSYTLGHTRDEVMHVIIVVKYSKQNIESNITNLNTPGYTGLDARNVERDSMRSRFI